MAVVDTIKADNHQNTTVFFHEQFAGHTKGRAHELYLRHKIRN